ncbi:hypothetical protein [Burkholderia pseudomultivorans]|uniref:hypothetical protein n=1 Tax=Burkholderia pseudomultivorans TaxID=1207504 RepID=UPI000AF47D4C|nr:hypothetical protein [Burkholderia pseudomultivorans]
MNQKSVFSPAEVDHVRDLLRMVRAADRTIQKALRERLRKETGFYISDFTKSNRGFEVDDSDELTKHGTIEIV